MTHNEFLAEIKKQNIDFVDLVFSDLFGLQHHFTVPAKQFGKKILEDGFPFDGSSIRAWQSIEKSDMLLKPDTTSFYRDPFRKHPTISVFCDVYNPRTGKPYSKDARSVLKKAVESVKKLGLGDTVYFGPEPEFFVFDSVRYFSDRHSSLYSIESQEALWSSNDENSLGHKMDYKGGYTPTSPMDTLCDYRNDVAKHLETMGIICELHHHEVATAGQCEINVRFDKAIYSADKVYTLKHAIKNTAHAYGKTATFMPKPIFEDNGSGMHTHLSIWKDGKNTFDGDLYCSLSQNALYAIGGILKHGRSIQAFTNPSSNSFRRLLPGYEAPVKLAYSSTNRSAAIRIPFADNDKARRIEFRCPDSSGSIHLAFAAIVMAAIDGITNKIDPGKPLDENIYALPKERLDQYVSTCKTQEEALEDLEEDMDWLRKDDVFTQDLIESYVNHRRENEVEPLKLRPNPYEFQLYYGV